MKLPYRRLDVFTERPLAGNPLAVVLDADGLDSAQMQAIAREFNLSETVFVLRARDPVNTARLRIFTPAVELPFAGHPTIGAAALIASERARDILGQAPIRLVLEEEVGEIFCEVARVKGALRAQFVVPRPPEIFEETLDAPRLSAALGLSADDVGFDAHRPVIASAGLPFAFVPVASRAVLNRAKPDVAALKAALLMERPAACLYTRETEDSANHVQARVFVLGLGAGEDPATGSAAAAFAAVAAKFEDPEDGEHTLQIEQGYAMGRPSLLTVSMQVCERTLTQIAVGGASVIVGEGFLRL